MNSERSEKERSINHQTRSEQAPLHKSLVFSIYILDPTYKEISLISPNCYSLIAWSMNTLHLTIETSINFPIINRAPKISLTQSPLLKTRTPVVNLTCFQYKQRQKNSTQQRGRGERQSRPEASCCQRATP